MAELRWTLLALGAIFIGLLAWWERRKRGQAPRQSDEHHSLQEPLSRAVREPVLTLPEMRARAPTAPEELPVVEIADDEMLAGLRAQDPEPGPEINTQTDPEADESFEEIAAVSAQGLGEPELLGEPAEAPVLHEAAGTESLADSMGPMSATPPVIGPPAAPAPAAAASGLPKLPQPEEPIVEWPPEQDRRIIALRIVCMGPERFSGRAVRTALDAEGFLLGKFSIYHKPGPDRRAVLSAASLSRPGVFDSETIDSQRFSGLSLFAVLPGPRTPRDAFEDLLATARNLNERLQGGLQDERGSPLTPNRVASLREGLSSAAAAGPAAVQS